MRARVGGGEGGDGEVGDGEVGEWEVGDGEVGDGKVGEVGEGGCGRVDVAGGRRVGNNVVTLNSLFAGAPACH